MSGQVIRSVDDIPPYEEGVRRNLEGADLRGSDLIYADLTNADLKGADLTNADLRGADLRGADLTDITLDQTRISFNTIIDNIAFAKLGPGLVHQDPPPSVLLPDDPRWEAGSLLVNPKFAEIIKVNNTDSTNFDYEPSAVYMIKYIDDNPELFDQKKPGMSASLGRKFMKQFTSNYKNRVTRLKSDVESIWRKFGEQEQYFKDMRTSEVLYRATEFAYNQPQDFIVAYIESFIEESKLSIAFLEEYEEEYEGQMDGRLYIEYIGSHIYTSLLRAASHFVTINKAGTEEILNLYCLSRLTDCLTGKEKPSNVLKKLIRVGDTRDNIKEKMKGYYKNIEDLSVCYNMIEHPIIEHPLEGIINKTYENYLKEKKEPRRKIEEGLKSIEPRHRTKVPREKKKRLKKDEGWIDFDFSRAERGEDLFPLIGGKKTKKKSRKSTNKKKSKRKSTNKKKSRKSRKSTVFIRPTRK